ncbi:glutamine synthetase family protein [Sulfitobacter sp. D35]|uniref:glutamine synthetase family protein n=1 Tax=Sulfitobacter sp. D35 TaxID=3083252 RepID=UPI00296ED105|nr:glutamine synthetase family protein [Sulfitobacter sp. D35]MDW4498114.1 glutamine synthetase family protein [Sulfitobacter sp. D35]
MTDRLDEIAQGRLARDGLLTPEAVAAARDLCRRVGESDVETVRVLFADQHGILRGKTIVASALPALFRSGMNVTSTLLLKDTSHRTVFPVWSGAGDVPGGLQGASDILMVPDPETFRSLPWTDASAWILCDARHLSGAAIAFDARTILKKAIARLAERGLGMLVGLEVEFHVFALDDSRLAHGDATMPARPPGTRNLTPGYQYLTELRYAAAETVLDDLRRASAAIGLPIRSMEIEMGPSQFEFTFDPADPLTHADNMVIFRTLVKEVCAARGLHATFMCRPALENCAASGWHLHQSVIDDATGENLMVPQDGGTLSDTASGWIAGLLEHAAESCLLTTPTVNGYKRYRPQQLAPDRIQWGRDNRGAMVRALMHPDDPASRVENRVAEPAANPYHYFASQILSGLDGIDRGLAAPAAVESPYDADAPRLPQTLNAAIAAFEASRFYRGALGDACVDHLVTIRRAEWDRYRTAVSAWEQAEYFGIY